MGDAWFGHAHGVEIAPGEEPDVETFREFAHVTVPPGNYVFVAKGAIEDLAGGTDVVVQIVAGPDAGDATPMTLSDDVGYLPFGMAGMAGLPNGGRIRARCWAEEKPVKVDFFHLVATQVGALHWPPA